MDMERNNELINDELKKLILLFKHQRLCQDLSQRELGKKCGYTQATISRLERMERNPSLITVLKVAHALGMEINITLTNFTMEANK